MPRRNKRLATRRRPWDNDPEQRELTYEEMARELVAAGLRTARILESPLRGRTTRQQHHRNQ